VLVGCTELSLLDATAPATRATAEGFAHPACRGSPLGAGPEASRPIPITDALEAVARRTITLAGGTLRDECWSDCCIGRER
jgi:hypothetical protein